MRTLPSTLDFLLCHEVNYKYKITAFHCSYQEHIAHGCLQNSFLQVLQMGQVCEALALQWLLPFLCMCTCLHVYTVTGYISQDNKKPKILAKLLFSSSTFCNSHLLIFPSFNLYPAIVLKEL